MKPETRKTVKLSNIAKAMALTLVLPTTAMAAFPELEGDFLQHINHPTNAGINLIPNPTFDVCIKDIPDEVFTSKPTSSCNTKADFKWGWAGGSDIDLLPENKVLQITGGNIKPIFDESGANNSLKATFNAVGISKFYIKFKAKINEATELKAQVQLQKKGAGEYDGGGGYVVLTKLPSAVTDWAEYEAEVTISANNYTVPYSNTVLLNFAGTANKEIDDVVFFTDVDLANYVPINDAPDTDGDGFSDDDENAVFSDPNDIDITPLNADNDDDGYLNTEEIEAGTDHEDPFDNPGSVDTDGDGYFDAEEVAEGSDVNDITKTPIDLDGDGESNSLLSSGSILNGSDKFPENAAASLDSDDDGYPNEFNASCDETCQAESGLTLDAATMIDRYEAYLDVDLDGQPESFIVAECKEGAVIEGADLAECNGLTLDTDFDSDEDSYSDQTEEEAGSDPLNPDSTPLDIDGDGWANDVDGSPMVNAYHLGKDQLTNILDTYAGDAENAELVAKGAGPVGVQWEMFENGGVEKGFELSVVEVEGHDGELTKAFRLYNATAEGNNKNIQLRSEKIVPVAMDTKLGRISGWVKISAPDGVIPTKVGARAVTKGNGVTNYAGKYFLDFAEGGKDQQYLNTDWYYFEAAIDNKGEVIEEFQIQLISDKTEGIEVLFDDLEFNLVTPADLDNDEIDNAIDRDDDNDGELDGVDMTPLGETPNDNDQDGILNAYDDDLDNDSIANPMDSAVNPVVIDVTKAVADSTTTLTAVTYYEGEEVVNYSWTLNGTEITESGNVLVIDNEDPNYTGRTFEVLTKAIAGDNDSAAYPSMVTIEGSVVNQPPEAEFASSKDENGNITVSALINEKDGDPVTYQWFVDGNEVDNNELSLMLNFADYEPGQEIKIDLVFSDGVNEPVTITETFKLNSAPFVIFNPEGESGETGFEVDNEERTTKVTIDVDDMDGDNVEITWYANGFPLTNSDGENLTGKSVTLNHTDYLNGSVVELEVYVTDGIGNAVHIINVQLPEAAEADELYPEGKGGSTWWLLTILMAGLTGRRLKK